MANKKVMKLAELQCIKSVVIYGRRTDGEPDQCFEEGKKYLFCYDEKENDIFTYNDVKEVHFLSLNGYFTTKHFEVLSIGNAEQFGLDELGLARMVRLFKERHDFSE